MSAPEALPQELPPELPPYLGLSMADVHWVDTPAQLARAKLALHAAPVIGFDTESKPTFRKGEVSTGPHLIQLATETAAYLFPVDRYDPAQPGFDAAGHRVLTELLGAPHSLKVGFGLKDDVRRLKAKLGIDTHPVLDLAAALRTERRKDIGAKSAVAQFFGQRLQKSKSVSTTNWARHPLTERQMRYAADDAHVALRIYLCWKARQSAGVGSAPTAAA